jgi:uncharacterized protein
LSLYFAAKLIYEVKSYDAIGMQLESPGTITLSGHGEVQAPPDIANVDFSIVKDDKTVKDAQAGVAVIEKKALDLLAQNQVDAKDIQTSNASFYPKYEYQNMPCPISPSPYPIPMGAVSGASSASPSYYCPPNSKQVLIGYEASENITVKVRNIDNVGTIMQGLGTTGVSNLNGPNFAIDNPDAAQAQAREKAIADAKQKAEVLAKDLGVSLGKITSFSDNGNYSVPMAYGAMAMDSMQQAKSAPPAVIPAGQNTVSSNVSITYEIR